MTDFYLNGDLCQMSAQKKHLSNNGFSVGQVDVYPTLKQEDVGDALNEIWQFKIDGWWNYKTAFIDHNICTEKEFKEALK